jgi:hypothetical protein
MPGGRRDGSLASEYQRHRQAVADAAAPLFARAVAERWSDDVIDAVVDLTLRLND